MAEPMRSAPNQRIAKDGDLQRENTTRVLSIQISYWRRIPIIKVFLFFSRRAGGAKWRSPRFFFLLGFGSQLESPTAQPSLALIDRLGQKLSIGGRSAL